MSAVLNTNVASMWTSKNLLGAQNKLAASVERLSSGLRINRARDDAAGLGISQSLTGQINGATQGARNLNDAISMVQTAEGAIAAAVDMAQRILTLATQGANDTLGATERAAIKQEMLKIVDSIDSIEDRTTFSGNSLLGGLGYSMQISQSSDDKIDLAATAFAKINSTDGAAVALATAVGSAADNATYGAVQTAARALITTLVTQRSELGAYQNQMEYTLSNITELASNLESARSRVLDADYASETAALTKGQILQQAATAMLAQANQMPNVILTLLK